MGILNRFHIRQLKRRISQATDIAAIDDLNGWIKQREQTEAREQHERDSREAFKYGEKVEAMAADYYKWKGNIYGPFPFS